MSPWAFWSACALVGCVPDSRLLPLAVRGVEEEGSASDEAPASAEVAVGPYAAAPSPDTATPSETAPEDDAPRPPGARLFSPGSLHRIELSLAREALQSLGRAPREPVPATLELEGERVDVAVRLKGSHSMRGIDGKPAFKVDFTAFDPEARFEGLAELTLNNMVQDRSMIREHTVYRAYADAGVPATRHAYAEVSVNGEPYGLYGVLDSMDRTFVRWAFPEDGEGWLYEGGDGADLYASRADWFAVQAEVPGAPPYADVLALVAELDRAEDVFDVLEARFDPSVYRMWAIDIAAAHRDGYVRRRNNYLLYHGAATDRWWVLPWGNDQAFRMDDGHAYDGFFGRLLTDCARSERCMERLDVAVLATATRWESESLAAFAEETGARIAEACEEDPRREMPCDHEQVLTFLQARPSELRAQVPRD